ncbi:MAG: hypothetical protein ACLPS1_06460, partial [Streptosporangiaceae bacterium]
RPGAPAGPADRDQDQREPRAQSPAPVVTPAWRDGGRRAFCRRGIVRSAARLPFPHLMAWRGRPGARKNAA